MEPPPRLKRAVELAYAVEGVVAARVWHSEGIVGLGIRVSPTASVSDVLRRVELAVIALREPEEKWEFGLLDDA